MVEKLEYLAVVLKKLYHLVVEARKRLVALILAGVVDGAAVKHVAAAVARRVVGDAFLVGEAHHAHRERVLLQVVGKLLQANKLFEHLAEVGILRIGVGKKMPEIGDGKRNALDEVGLLLEVAAEAVGAEHLKRAEQHEVAQLGVEIVAVYGSVFAQGVDIFLQQLAAEAVGKVGLGLP